MTKADVTEVLLSSLEKEVTVYCYDYEENKVEYLSDGIKLWNLIVVMYILNSNIKSEKVIEKLESIIKQPKILVFFVKSLKKILYIWLKDYDLHCKLIIKLYPEIYNPKRLLKLYEIEINE
jgi:hypothetical protein